MKRKKISTTAFVTNLLRSKFQQITQQISSATYRLKRFLKHNINEKKKFCNNAELSEQASFSVDLSIVFLTFLFQTLSE